MSSELTVRNFVDMVERIAARGTCSFCKRASEQCGCFPYPPYNDDEPPSYLPARDPLPAHIPDLCPDERRDEHDAENCKGKTA